MEPDLTVPSWIQDIEDLIPDGICPDLRGGGAFIRQEPEEDLEATATELLVPSGYWFAPGPPLGAEVPGQEERTC